jgi:hypothetical protein
VLPAGGCAFCFANKNRFEEVGTGTKISEASATTTTGASEEVVHGGTSRDKNVFK